jgi:hypothetical protein
MGLLPVGFHAQFARMLGEHKVLTMFNCVFDTISFRNLYIFSSPKGFRKGMTLFHTLTLGFGDIKT